MYQVFERFGETTLTAPTKKRTNTSLLYLSELLRDFFTIKFLNFSQKQNKPPGNIGLVVAGGPRLSWLWGFYGALKGTTSTRPRFEGEKKGDLLDAMSGVQSSVMNQTTCVFGVVKMESARKFWGDFFVILNVSSEFTSNFNTSQKM